MAKQQNKNSLKRNHIIDLYTFPDSLLMQLFLLFFISCFMFFSSSSCFCSFSFSEKATSTNGCKLITAFNHRVSFLCCRRQTLILRNTSNIRLVLYQEAATCTKMERMRTVNNIFSYCWLFILSYCAIRSHIKEANLFRLVRVLFVFSPLIIIHLNWPPLKE